MSRYDKYDPVSGGFRAPLAADFDPANLNKVLGVGLDVNGRVVIGDGNTGVLAALVLTKALKAGDIVDCMTDGEVVEFPGAAGTVYGSDAAGAIAAGGATRIGHTVEASRLIVRVAR